MMGRESTLLTSGRILSFTFSIDATRDFISLEKFPGRGLYAPRTIFIARKCNEGASKGGF
jgi:hypothetical protein